MKQIRSTIGPVLSLGRASLLFFLFLSGTTQAQWNAVATLDTQQLRIGEQTTLMLTLEYVEGEKANKIQLPETGKRISEKIEVLERRSVDTLIPHEDKAPDIRRIELPFRITSFDSGRHRIPPFHFRVNGDSISTGPLFLKVNSVKLGKKTKNLKPIKGIERFPYTWRAWFQEHWPWIAAGGAVLVIALLLFLYYRKRKDRKVETAPPPRPPHESALERLRSMELEKAWQEKDPKAFYSELTDLLRHYIEERYQIPALETTTARIVHELAFTDIDDEGKGRLRRILQKADLVKFAKQEASTDERESSLKEAIAFVERSISASKDREQGMENEG